MVMTAISRGLRIWWANLVHLTLFNLLWLLCQVLIIPAPAATAVLYIVVRRYMDDEMTTIADATGLLRSVFVQAWKWGLCNALVLGVLALYWAWGQTLPGELGSLMKAAALIAALTWIALNLVYWPLWLEQDDVSLRNTLRNALVLAVSNPGAVLALLLICVGLAVVGVLTVFPLLHFLMVWIVLLSSLLCQSIIQQMPRVSNTTGT
jgi:uncharacterized membrane protein YesL